MLIAKPAQTGGFCAFLGAVLSLCFSNGEPNPNLGGSPVQAARPDEGQKVEQQHEANKAEHALGPNQVLGGGAAPSSKDDQKVGGNRNVPLESDQVGHCPCHRWAGEEPHQGLPSIGKLKGLPVPEQEGEHLKEKVVVNVIHENRFLGFRKLQDEELAVLVDTPLWHRNMAKNTNREPAHNGRGLLWGILQVLPVGVCLSGLEVP